MEDTMYEYKCTCLGINILRHLTTVDPRSEVATDERDEIVWRLLGLIPSSTEFSISSVDDNSPSCVRPTSKCKYNKYCSLPLPDVVLSCSSSPFVRPKSSPKECGRLLKHMADQFTNRRRAQKTTSQAKDMSEFQKKYLPTLLQTLFSTCMKFLKFLKR